MKSVHCLSVQSLDQLSDNLSYLFDHSVTMRSLLCMYVTESQFMVPIPVNQLLNILWDITKDFCSLLNSSSEIVSNAEFRIFLNDIERSDSDVSK